MAKSLQGQTTRKKKKIKRLRKFGFRSRMTNWTGRNVLKRRRLKKRTTLSASDEISGKMEKDKKFRRRR